MTCTANELKDTMRQFRGGSDKRYRHNLNPAFIYTEGTREVAVKAEAYWLLDLMALELAPVYAKAWLANETGIGMVKLEVYPEGASGPGAKLTLSLADDTPDAVTRPIRFTTFPEGTWMFYFGTDEDGEDNYVTTVMIPEEY